MVQKTAGVKRRIVGRQCDRASLSSGVPWLLAIIRHDDHVKEIPCKNYTSSRDVCFLFRSPGVRQRELHHPGHRGSQLGHEAFQPNLVHIVGSLCKNWYEAHLDWSIKLSVSVSCRGSLPRVKSIRSSVSHNGNNFEIFITSLIMFSKFIIYGCKVKKGCCANHEVQS